MVSTARRSHGRKPRRCASQPSAASDAHPNCRRPPLPLPLPPPLPPPPTHPLTPVYVEEPTDSSLTSSESSTPEENPPIGQQTFGGILYVTNVLTGVVHVAGTAPVGADSVRSVEYDGKRLQTACRCRLKLPATCYMIQRQPPLPGQSLSGCGPDGASEDNRKFWCFRPQLKLL